MNPTQTAVRWNAPNFGPAVIAPPVAAERSRPSVEDLAAIERSAREEGFERGKREGFAQGEAEVNRLIAHLGSILNGFTRPLETLDDDVHHALGELAVNIAGALLGSAYAADPALLELLVRTALTEAGAEAREAVVHLHPADLAVLRPRLEPLDAQLIADASLARAEVRVHTPQMRIDGGMLARLRQAALGLTEAQP